MASLLRHSNQPRCLPQTPPARLHQGAHDVQGTDRGQGVHPAMLQGISPRGRAATAVPPRSVRSFGFLAEYLIPFGIEELCSAVLMSPAAAIAAELGEHGAFWVAAIFSAQHIGELPAAARATEVDAPNTQWLEAGCALLENIVAHLSTG